MTTSGACGLESCRRRGGLIIAPLLLVWSLQVGLIAAGAEQTSVATFRSGVDLVRVSAVVRDRRGRFVQNLSARDFQVLNGGERRTIADFRHDLAGISVVLLFDVSGSMEARLAIAREAVSVRAASDPAPQDQRDQLRRRQTGWAEHDKRRLRAESASRSSRAGIVLSVVSRRLSCDL